MYANSCTPNLVPRPLDQRTRKTRKTVRTLLLTDLFYLVLVKIFITSVNLASFVEYVHFKRKTSNHLPIWPIYLWKLLINYENGQVFSKYQRAEKHLISTSATFIITISVQTIVKYFFCLKPLGSILPWLKSGTGRSSNSLVLISKVLISYICHLPPPQFIFWDKFLLYRCLL